MNFQFSRAVRRAVRRALPAGPRGRLRQWYEGRLAAPDRAIATLTAAGDTLRVSLLDGPTILLPAEFTWEFEMRFGNSEDSAEIQAVRKYAPRPGLLFDVGAHRGFFSTLHCLLHEGNRAVAFEPSADIAADARNVAAANGVADRVQVLDLAVADRHGTHTVTCDRETGWIQPMQYEGSLPGRWVPKDVTTTTLDRQADALGIPSFVKIDVEGYEWEVLRGAADLIRRRSAIFMIEVHLSYLEERRIAPSEVMRPLVDGGYDVRDLHGEPLSAARLNRNWARVAHVLATPH